MAEAASNDIGSGTPVKSDAKASVSEKITTKTVRVGSFENVYNYVNEKGMRQGYGYELLEKLSGYTGWKFDYADVSSTDVSEHDFKTLSGKRVGVLENSQPEAMLTKWEKKYDIETEHVNIADNEDIQSLRKK